MGAIAESLVGRTLLGIDGQRVGRILAIYVNDSSGEPEWVAVRTGGLFGAKLIFAPVAEVAREGEHAVVTFDKKYLKHTPKHAPRAETKGALSPAENDDLYRYYGIDRNDPYGSGSRDASLWAGH